MHETLCVGGTFSLRWLTPPDETSPIASLSPPPGASCGVQWTDEELVFAARTDDQKIHFKKSELADLAVKVGAYGRPVDPNFKSVDSVVPLGRDDSVACLFFQATQSPSHGIKAAGLAEAVAPFDALDQGASLRPVVLLFAVPSENFESFKQQPLTGSGDKRLALDKLPAALQGSRVRQGVIRI